MCSGPGHTLTLRLRLDRVQGLWTRRLRPKCNCIAKQSHRQPLNGLPIPACLHHETSYRMYFIRSFNVFQVSSCSLWDQTHSMSVSRVPMP